MMQQFQINIKKINTACSQSCPAAKARSRYSLSSTTRSETSSSSAVLAQYWGHPSCCTSLPADSSAASSSRASNWVNKTRRKTKLRRNITSYVCFLSDCCLDGEISPTSPLKRLKRFRFLFSSIHVCNECSDRTMAFLPDIVFLVLSFMFLFLSHNICEHILWSPAVVCHQTIIQQGIHMGPVPKHDGVSLKSIIVETNILWFLLNSPL